MVRCALCLQDRDLRKSHLMPKSLYRVIRNAFPGGGKGLVFSSVDKGTSAYTNKQVVANLLCEDCEGLFDKKGEEIVCSECYRGKGNFLLQDTTKKSQVSFINSGERWINPIKETTDLNYCGYLYFGASIIWRASAGKWPNFAGKIRGSLGVKYQEQLRKFLLGETGFPSNIYLLVYVDEDKNPLPILSFPAAKKFSGYHSHVFYIPGIKFSFFVGSVTGEIGKVFQKEKTQVFFIGYYFRESVDFQQLAEFTKTDVEPRGRLARDFQSRNS